MMAWASSGVDAAPSFAAKRRFVFSPHMDTKRKRMTGISAFPEPVYPVIADANTSRSQGIISRERLIGARVIVAPLEHQVFVGIQDFASPLCISAQRGGFPRCIADHDLLTVLPEQLPST